MPVPSVWLHLKTKKNNLSILLLLHNLQCVAYFQRRFMEVSWAMNSLSLGVNPSNPLPLADPGAGARNTGPPPSNFFHFHAVFFWQQFCRIIGSLSHLRGWFPIWDILDLPLLTTSHHNWPTALLCTTESSLRNPRTSEWLCTISCIII